MRYTRILVLLAGLSPALAQANLILNPSFETVPEEAVRDQGVLPTGWVNIAPPTPGADTYSNDGSFGLLPGGNFTGVAAHDGIRWVAGWSALGQESFGQWLATPLAAGTVYELSAWLHQAVRPDLNNPGGYEVFLTDTPGVQSNLIGFLGSTTSVGAGWQRFSFTFSATELLSSLSFIEFGPIVTSGDAAYPGLDLVSLTAVGRTPVSVPAPASGVFLLSGLALLGIRRFT